MVKVIPPAPVNFFGAANVETVVVTKLDTRVAFAVAAKSVVVAPPVPAHPIATVAEPELVTAVVTFTVPPVRIALAGMVVFLADGGVIVETDPPSDAKLYCAHATPNVPLSCSALEFVVGIGT